jgi:apolipoprotein N-acyltransferase
LDTRTRLPLCVTVPIVWTALEFLRAHFLTGFPWYFLGHSQHEFLALIQISDLGGAYAVTFLIAAVNAMGFEWWSRRGWWQSHFHLPIRAAVGLKLESAILIAAVAAVLIYGWYRLGQEDSRPGPRVALIQGNVEQRIRNQATTTDAERDAVVGGMLRHYLELNDQAIRQQPDLLVWPETSFPDEWWELTADFAAADLTGLDSRVQWDSITKGDWRSIATLMLNREIVNPLRRWPTDVLIGIGCRVQSDGDRDHGTRFNSALLLRSGQDPPFFERYDKIHRVPFGEYLPFRDSLPFMKVFSPYENEYGIRSGERYTRFPLGEYRYGVLICFEDTDPYLARQYVRPGGEGEPAVDFLLNISNDGWFGGSSEHDQHLAICRFRAIECRRSIGRSVNMGISAVIDGSGRIVALPGKDWTSSKSVAAVVTANIPIDRRQSLYARWGDWLPVGCWLALAGGLVWSFANARGRPV